MEHYDLTREHDLFTLLEEAIRQGDAAERVYSSALEHTDDPELRKVLADLVTMERRAHDTLVQKLDELKRIAELQDEINDSYD